MSRPPVAFGFDPASQFGWAAVRMRDSQLLACGTWRLVRSDREPRGLRYRRLRGHLQSAFEAWWPVEIIAYEHVPATLAVRGQRRDWYGGLVAVIEEEAAAARITPVTVNVATAKSAMAGYGGASKRDMVRAARMQWPDVDIPDDNAADAAAVAIAAVRRARLESRIAR